jgi:hypothetical protein
VDNEFEYSKLSHYPVFDGFRTHALVGKFSTKINSSKNTIFFLDHGNVNSGSFEMGSFSNLNTLLFSFFFILPHTLNGQMFWHIRRAKKSFCIPKLE